MLGEIFGRDGELRLVDAFLDDLSAAPRALVVAGFAGAGKTALFDEAVLRARTRGLTILEARPSESELPLPFAGLSDLVEPYLDGLLDELPVPQRRALGVALLVEQAPPRPPEPRVIAAAFRSAVLALSREAPVLVAIDDVQWLDAPTAAAVGFAFRRLVREPVGLLCTQRAGAMPLELERARLQADLLPLGPLGLGALHRTLRTRLGASFSHSTLRRIETDSDGNPLIALEIGRALRRRGITRAGVGALPVPDTLSGLVDERLGQLAAPVTEVLRTVAAMTDPSIDRVLATGAAGEDLDAAVAAGVLASDADRLRFTHPLLASAVVAATPPAAHRRLHALLAAHPQRPEERARHLALAADGPSATTAAELDSAAELARARGAPATAAELLEQAAALTPTTRPGDARRRQLDAAVLFGLAGETRAAVALLEDLIAALPPGRERAGALAQLGWVREDDFESSSRLLDQALAEAGDDAARTTAIHLSLSDIWGIRGNVVRARAESRMALIDAERTDDRALLASSLAQAVWFDWMCGEDVNEAQLERALTLEHEVESLALQTPPSEVAGLYHMSVGRLDQAHEAFERALVRAEAEGVEYWRADLLLRLAAIAGMRGHPQRAAELAATGLEIAEQLDLTQLQSALLYGCGLAALQQGQVDASRSYARRGLALSGSVGDQIYQIGNEGLLGAVDLAVGDYSAAAARLHPLVGRLHTVGRRPSTQWIAADAIEALIGAGQIDHAERLMATVEPRGHDPIGATLAARCRGQLAAARGDLDDAISQLEDALRLHDQTPLPLDRGRTLLALGGVQRRLKQRRAARETLTEAIATFDTIGAALWSARTVAELARVSGRAPRSGELTATELRVVDLVGQGLSNRQVAAETFVTVRAVESTLTKVYAKLGVHSRTQLITRLQHTEPL